MPDTPQDQAEGLRRRFAAARPRFVPVVSNPHVAFGGVMLERLCTAFGERGLKTLVVDAGEHAGEHAEMALVDLGDCIERLSEDVSYLAARGLPIRFVDATGSTRSLIERLADAAPAGSVVLVHASASELCRLFSGPSARRSARPSRSAFDRAPADADADLDAICPIVLVDDRPSSVTHAYASMKLLAQRAGLVVTDLLLGAAPQSPRAERIAARLAACADGFIGAASRGWARIDPAGDPLDVPGTDLRRIVAAQLGLAPVATMTTGISAVGRPLRAAYALQNETSRIGAAPL